MIEVLNSAQATEILRAHGYPITPESLRLGLKDRRYPFGEYIPGEDGKIRVCHISKRLLMEWISARESIPGISTT